jgi:hypothetical protein
LRRIEGGAAGQGRGAARMTWIKRTVPCNSIEAAALRCERHAVISEFNVVWVPALMKMTGWREGIAMLVMARLILAYEIGASLRESPVRFKMKGKRLTAPPEALARPWREVYALTEDIRAVALVERAFLIGWKRNKRSDGGAPKKTAGATVIELMKRTGETKDDRRTVDRMRKRLKKMVEEFRSRSPTLSFLSSDTL